MFKHIKVWERHVVLYFYKDCKRARLGIIQAFTWDANTKKGNMRVSRIEVPLGTRGITTITNG